MTLDELKANAVQNTSFPKDADTGVIQNLNRTLSGDDGLHPALKRAGYFARVASDVGKGLGESVHAVSESVKKNMSGEGLDPFSTGIQVAAPLVKAAAAPVTEVFTSAFDSADKFSGGAISKAIEAFGQSEGGKDAKAAIQSLAGMWHDFTTKHPTLAADAKSILDIATNLPVVAGEANFAKVVAKNAGPLAKNVSESIAAKAAAPVVKNTDELAKLVQSIDDAAGKNLKTGGEISKKGWGPLAKNVVEPSKADNEIAQMFVDQLEVGNPVKSAQNLTSHIDDVSENVVKPFLAENNAIFNKNTLSSKLRSVINDKPLNFTANEGEKAYEKVVDTAIKMAGQQPKNMEGLWEARKAFDRAVLEQFPHAYEGASTATKQAIRNVRQAMNDFIIKGTGGSKNNLFAESMGRLSKAFDVRDNLLEKAASTMNQTKASQFIQAHPNLVTGAKIVAPTVGIGGAVGAGIHALKH